MSIAANITAARCAAGLTQAALASKLGTSRTVVCQYETGYRRPRLSRLKEIATALGTTVSALTKEER